MLGNDWDLVLSDEINKQYFKDLLIRINSEYDNNIVYPKKEDVFKAFRLTSYENTKVVILGQDPYHGEFQAEGLSFSVRPGVAMPPSLKNIFKELKDDIGFDIPKNGSLVHWAEEGVLLLNAVLTVESGKPTSHKNYGWETFTDSVIKKLNEKKKPVVFIFWGSYARSKKQFITNPNHLVIESAHPSPLSAFNGFFGSKPFSRTNNYLESKNIKKIDWKL